MNTAWNIEAARRGSPTTTLQYPGENTPCALCGIPIVLQANIATTDAVEVKRGPERRGFRILAWGCYNRATSNRTLTLTYGSVTVGTASTTTAGALVWGISGGDEADPNDRVPRGTALMIDMNTGTSSHDVFVIGVWEDVFGVNDAPNPDL